MQGTPAPVASQPHPSDYDPNNTTLFIGGLSSGVSEDDLRVLFGRFGDIVYTKIPPGKGCGFVQFVQRLAAEGAMAQMQAGPFAIFTNCKCNCMFSWGILHYQVSLASLEGESRRALIRDLCWDPRTFAVSLPRNAALIVASGEKV